MTRAAFFLSMIANLALAWWLLIGAGSKSTNIAASAAETETAIEIESPAPDSYKATPAPEQQDARPIRWADIATPDMGELAANLRDLGCPEAIVADLLVPEINRQAELDTVAAFIKLRRDVLPWDPSPEWDAMAPENMTPKIFHDEEGNRDALVKSLFGKWKDKHWPDLWPSNPLDTREDRMAFLDASIREDIERLDRERNDEHDRLRTVEPRPTDEEIRSTLRNYRAGQIQELKNAHPGEQDQLEEYTLRTSPFVRIPQEVPGIDLTPDELREIVRIFDGRNHERAADFSDRMNAIHILIGGERFHIFEPIALKKLENIKIH
ncbi:MAG: hypothetical protein ACI9R3_005068 [Verrucomicrobiales bacterium]|jgi:hypothetical protein